MNFVVHSYLYQDYQRSLALVWLTPSTSLHRHDNQGNQDCESRRTQGKQDASPKDPAFLPGNHTLQLSSHTGHILAVQIVAARLNGQHAQHHREEIAGQNNKDHHLRPEMSYQVFGRKVAPKGHDGKDDRQQSGDALDDTLARPVQEFQLFALHVREQAHQPLVFVAWWLRLEHRNRLLLVHL